MKKFLFFFMGLLTSLFVGAQEVNQEVENSNWVETKMPFTYQNIQVPRELWNLVKETMLADGATAEQVENFSINPTSVTVELSSQDPKVLKESKNQKLLFTDGGGDLDLFEYVPGRGQFYLRFSPHLENGSGFHVFYLSDSPGKEIEGSQWGNGCGNLYDISKSSDKFLGQEGMLLTTSKRHYLHLMAGVFVFFQLVDERLHLGYIRIKDSRYPNFNCKNS